MNRAPFTLARPIRLTIPSLLFLAVPWLFAANGHASNQDTIGVTLLRAATTNLDGTGVGVVQVEAGAPAWEVNPGTPGIQLATNRFTYYSTNASANNYPNALGSESGHADGVAGLFFGLPNGVSTNVARIDAYEAGYFALTVVPTQIAIPDRVVNQSYNFAAGSISQQQALDTLFDNYATRYNTLFVTAVGNGGAVNPPATCYNGIGTAASGGGATSVGPTSDNGRAKPDITAPGSATSEAAPLVAGGAAILMQAGLRGDGGNNTNAAVDARVLKSLLLNGAIKPADWANPSPSPLDPRYGTGVLNIFNSYKQLTGGKNPFIASTTASPPGGSHPPSNAAGNVGTLSGWDFNTLSSSVLADGINHYFFNLVSAVSNTTFTGTLTVVWNRGTNGLNDLDLYLYNATSGSLITLSTSRVDNVEHIFATKLLPGRYDLQVLKNGGLSGRSITDAETYSLAFEFSAVSLGITNSGGNVLLNWPIYPAGFVVESTASITPPATWSTVNQTPVVTNDQNRILVNSSSGNQFFRLRRP
jgi:hypothetical protein